MTSLMKVLKRPQKRISELLNKNFYEVWLFWKESLYSRYVLKGGRGSAKSSHIAIFIVLSIILEPVSAVCFRKVGETLSRTVYEQIKWAIQFLGVEEYFKFKASPLEIIYVERGNKIIFLGVDDPQKSKSIKLADFPLALYWFEELAEFKTEAEVETVIRSITRGKLKNGLKYKGFFSYNPPQSKLHWVNKKYSFGGTDDNTYVHHSTYLDNPHISEQFLEDAENLKKRNELKYRHEYLGEAIGNGIIPFPNLQIRQITKEDLDNISIVRQGLDWGYGVDPVAFVRWGYSKKKKIIYALDEYYGVKRSNKNVAEYILSKGYEEPITCDSSEPKSIDDLREHELSAWGATKGKGSVEYGEKWLGDLEAIVIDPARTPNIAKEFQIIDYATDKDGNPLPRLEDKNNHTIDATRYAFERDMKKGKYVY
ncbi:MAG: PBSX family phage terminase large subunit [Fusobacterium sp.]|uniref:PBSX family phage terminase large subunit n=2 Tax=Fusobacterium sp. TaxID=68766 RepID=UPI003999E1A5|nr:PBSX family phage terminase large subunit [Fusobacterium varium]